MACFFDHEDVIRLLFQKGGDINSKDDENDAPLHHACYYGSIKTVRFLLDHGADPDARGSVDDTPLHEACRKGHPEIVRLLLDVGADSGKRNAGGHTPLDLCVGLLPTDNPHREEIIDLFREYAPELVMERFCAASQAPGM